MAHLRHSKTGHLFQTIFMVLFLLLVCMLAYMSFFMNRFVLRDQQADLDRSNLAVLDQANDAIDRTVTSLEQQVSLFLSDSATLAHLLSGQPPQAEDRMQTLQSMEHYVDLSPQVTGLWLYAPLANTVLSFNGYLTTRSESPIHPILTQYEAMEVPRSASDMYRSALLADGELYILFEFAPAQPLGCFLFQVDPEQLGLDLDPALPSILVVDRDGALLLEGPSPARSHRTFDLSREDQYYADPDLPHQDQPYYRADNSALGWTLLMESYSGASQRGSTIFWMMMAPFLLLLLLMGTMGAHYITTLLYAPIGRLMALARQEGGPQRADAPQTEVEYLASTYQQTLTENETLRATYRQTLTENETLQTRFNDLRRETRTYLVGKAVEGRLNSTLDEDAIRAFIPQGRFQAVLVRLDGGREAGLRTQLANLAAKDLPPCLCTLDQDQNDLLLVLHFPEEPPAGHTEVLVAQFLSQAAHSLSCPLLRGLGRTCGDLYHLQDSCRQAVQDLNYHIKLASADPAARRVLNTRAMEEHLNAFLDQAFQSQEDPEQQTDRLLHLILEGTAGEEEADLHRRLACDRIQARLRTWDASADLPDLDLAAPIDPESFRAFCLQSLELGRTMAGKKKFRYIDDSKRFIQANYQNCALSANEISNTVGISFSYFSSLFNEVQGESVTSYLNRTRVEAAKDLLTTSSLSIKEVGQQCGFNSPNVFGRVFKKYTGCSPSQYREDPNSIPEGADPFE